MKTHLQLRQLTKNLEQRVAEKTADLETALTQLQQSHLQLVQSEKMSALGNLVAGVAHEINNPLNFIAGNLKPAQNYIKDLFQLISLYQKELSDPSATLQAFVEEIDLEYLQEDLPKLIDSMQQGVSVKHTFSGRRIKRGVYKSSVGLLINADINGSLNILRKAIPEAFAQGIEGIVVSPVKVKLPN
ncbi:hypothetical protein [Nostoc sp.]|uniref:hypothetical protein n=1 Tax=Nostoc sp. TaxID=1180 RepID=UPI0035930D37